MVSHDDIRMAADLIRQGGLVAFPTETVYGLGANALDERAVARVYDVKGRPAVSPLIVHVSSIEMARELAAEWPESAERLARRYWPGPLTLVLPKRPKIPDLVTAGLQTVGLRMPAHPVALDLIREAGVPIAAPSANRFAQLSPTTAGHVRESLGGLVDLVLDAGPTDVGIESTVLSLAGERPLLLRLGMISRRDLEELIGPVEVAEAPPPGSHASPGLHPRHYSPRTPLVLVRQGRVPAQGRGAFLGFAEGASAPTAELVSMPPDPALYAAMLYQTLHRLDREGLDWIAVEQPPDTPDWAAILDRLKRAAEG
ncbi:MAG: L-threonylcarbamoyladenylate synthase [Bryobacteraceae bacterium]